MMPSDCLAETGYGQDSGARSRHRSNTATRSTPALHVSRILQPIVSRGAAI